MSTSVDYVVISTSPEVSTRLPMEPAMRSLVPEPGLRQWRIYQALEGYKRGQGTLAYAAEQAGVSVREIIPLAYAHGLTPPVDPEWLRVCKRISSRAERPGDGASSTKAGVDPEWLTSPLTLEQAAQL